MPAQSLHLQFDNVIAARLTRRLGDFAVVVEWRLSQ